MRSHFLILSHGHVSGRMVAPSKGDVLLLHERAAALSMASATQSRVTRPLAFVTRFPDFASGKSRILLRFAALKDDGLYRIETCRDGESHGPDGPSASPSRQARSCATLRAHFLSNGRRRRPRELPGSTPDAKAFDRIEGWIPTLPGVYDPGWPALERHWTSVDT